MTPLDDRFGPWLASLGLATCAETFEKNDVTFDVLRHLSDADLKELGLSLGHRRILMSSLQAMHGGARGAVEPAGQGAPGERRQLTVMFCDLVGSTELSARLDLDDLRSLLHAYYSSCCKIIEDGGGFIARLVGDGILAYFGYPMAREDAAECAIRAGLEIVDTLSSERLDGRSEINVRIGVATGMAVISDMVGSHFAERHAVTGQTPNLAARIQALALPGSLLVGDDTRRLAGGLFEYADAGLQAMKGLDLPVQVWRVVGESGSSVRYDAQRAAHADCLGRDAELAALQQAWELAQAGRCRVVNVVGEAGIGKSRLLRTASERCARSNAFSVLMQCSPNQTSTPLHPLVAWIRRETGVSGADPVANRRRLVDWLGRDAAALDLALMTDLLGIPVSDVQPLPAMLPDRRRHLTHEVVRRLLERHCDAGPVLLMIEDAHWMDGATEDFLRSLFVRLRERPCMALITSRPPLARGWGEAAAVTDLVLEPLRQADAERLVLQACQGRTLPPAVIGQILAKTDGIPLFIEELTATVLESGMLDDDAAAAADAAVGRPGAPRALPPLDIPSTLRDSLMARLDRLNDAKEVARVGSALGREFSFVLLAQVTGQSTRRLAAALDRLVDAQLLFQRGVPPAAEYVFKHALVQQAAYEGQLRHDRQALHARIVHAIETHQGDMARHEPGLMAQHCQQAGLPDKEADYLYAAGLASTRMVAIAEALAYFTRAEATVAGLEQTPRNVARHIDIILGLMEVGRFAILPGRLVELGARARALSRLDGVACDAATLSAILFQEGRARLYSSRYADARRMFQEIRQLGRETGSPRIEMKPASAFTMTLCCQGLFNETLVFMNEGNVGHYKDTGSPIDYIAGLGWIGYASCQSGPGDDGLRFADRSVQEAEHVQSPIYLGGAHVWRSHALMSVRRLDEAAADAQRCVTLSRQHGVPYLGWHGLVFLALCECRRGDFEAAERALADARLLLAQIEDGQWTLIDYLPAIEAEIACLRGDVAGALAAAERAIAVAAPRDGHFAEAIAWRVKALAGLAGGGDAQAAQACFDNAVRLFEHGGARAEQAFATLVWAHALQQAGHASRARRAAQAARELAQRHGFALSRCEHGAAAML